MRAEPVGDARAESLGDAREPNHSVPPAELNQSLPHEPSLDLTEDPTSVEITEPTLVKSTLGNMQVYPDNFVGPLPPGAVREGETATGSHNGVKNWEWQVMGMGDYSKEKVSDNAIRKDFGKEQRPNYGGVTW